MIRIGPAGIPLSCKGRTLKDGVIYTKSLELDALEVQFVRGIRMSEEEAAEVGEVAKEADIELHVHAPYYTNLAGDEANLQMTFDKVTKAAKLADLMGARTTVVHPGFYVEDGGAATLERVVGNVQALLARFREQGAKCRLGLVTMGKKQVFGTLDEIVEVCRRVGEGVIPVLDFGAIHARGNGSLQTKEDFQEIFDKLAPLGLSHHLLHFTGVSYDGGNEKHHVPIKKGDLRFEPLVDVILDNAYSVTIISNSPILEHDAMYMQIVLDRVKEKREQRIQREEQVAKQEEERKKVEEERRKEAERRAKEKEREEKRLAREREIEAKRKAREEAKRQKELEQERKRKLIEREREARKKQQERERLAREKQRKLAGKKKSGAKRATSRKCARPSRMVARAVRKGRAGRRRATGR